MTGSLKKFIFVFAACVATCHGAAIGTPNFAANVAKGLRLIETAEGVVPVWVTQQEKLELLKKDKNFVSSYSLPEPQSS
jgi:leucyl aminopeptidase